MEHVPLGANELIPKSPRRAELEKKTVPYSNAIDRRSQPMVTLRG